PAIGGAGAGRLSAGDAAGLRGAAAGDAAAGGGLDRGLWGVFPISEALALGIFWLWQKSRPAERGAFPPERVFRRLIHSQTGALGDLAQEVEAFCDRWDASPGSAIWWT